MGRNLRKEAHGWTGLAAKDAGLVMYPCGDDLEEPSRLTVIHGLGDGPHLVGYLSELHPDFHDFLTAFIHLRTSSYIVR